MQKKFLSNLFLLLALNLLVKPLWILGIDRGFQNMVGFEEYGNYHNLFTFSLILSVVLDLGINNFVSSGVAKDPQKANELYVPLLIVKLVFGVLYILITLAAGYVYGYSSQMIFLLCWLCANMLLAYIATFNRSFVTGLQLYKTDAWLSVIDRLVMLIAGVFLVWIPLLPTTITSFIAIQTLGYLLVMLISAVVLFFHLKNIQINWKLGQIYPVLKQALPYATLALLMMCYSRGDILLLKKMHANGSYENGVYAAGNRLFEAANMFAVLVSAMLLPMFSATLAKNEQLTKPVRTAVVLLPAFGLLVSAFCWFYRVELIALMYHKNEAYLSEVFGTQMISFTMMCGMYVFGTLLTAAQQMRLLNKLALLALIMNVLLNYFFIPDLGALACARIALLTHTFIFFANLFFALKKLPVNLHRIDLAKYIFVLAVVSFSAAILHYYKINFIPAAFICGLLWALS